MRIISSTAWYALREILWAVGTGISILFIVHAMKAHNWIF